MQTIPEFLESTVTNRGDEPALGCIVAGELHWQTWSDVFEAAQQNATAIRTAGVGPGDRVAHVSENRYEWVITDLAIHLAGAVHVPMHVTLSGEQIANQIADCGARLVIVSSRKLLSTFVDRIPADVEIRLHDQDDEQGKGMERSLLHPEGTRPAVAPSPQPPAPSPDDLATILYTSGTTGRPRGVMLTQRNLASNAAAMSDAHGGDYDQTRLCILPLTHIYARTCDLYTWVYRGSRLVLAERRETLVGDLQLAQPTVINAVPYVYQRIADQIRACGVSDERAALKQFFGGHMQRLCCGGAALAPAVENWYAEQGLPVLAGYGLTEASPVIAASTPTMHKIGSVGPPLPGIEVRLADDGEIIVRGPNVMLGYWQADGTPQPGDAIRNGWLHTGDLGELDHDGFLFIRGRKKELIVLSTGKKVLPTRVENLLCTSPLIEQAAVFGDGHSCLSALIVPSTCGLATSVNRESVREQLATEINRCLAAAAHEEQIHKFALLQRPFSIERGELTPKMSLCRAVIARNFSEELQSISPQSARSTQSKQG